MTIDSMFSAYTEQYRQKLAEFNQLTLDLDCYEKKMRRDLQNLREQCNAMFNEVSQMRAVINKVIDTGVDVVQAKLTIDHRSDSNMWEVDIDSYVLNSGIHNLSLIGATGATGTIGAVGAVGASYPPYPYSTVITSVSTINNP